MDLRAAGEHALSGAQHYKSTVVAKHGPDVNFDPTVDVYRDGELVAICQVAGQVDSDKLLQLISIAGPGYRADVMTVVFEGWTVGSESPSKEINPDTGKEWEYGEMQEYVAKHGRDGVVGDGFSLIVATSEGKLVGGSQPFRPVSGSFGWTVAYDEPMWIDESDGNVMAGDMVAACREAMDRTGDVGQMTEQIRVVGAGEGLDPVTVDADMDCIITQALVEMGIATVVLVCTEDQVQRRAAITKRMGRPPVASIKEAFERAAAPWN